MNCIPEILQHFIDMALQDIKAEFGDEKVVVIMRGVPGSGLSTVAHGIAGVDGIVHSTDSFFIDNSGVYVFDGLRLKEYHQANYDAAVRSMQEGKCRVVIDNTNIRRNFFRGYITAANANGYGFIEIKIPFPDPEVAAARNLCGVPSDKIEQMINLFEA